MGFSRQECWSGVPRLALCNVESQLATHSSILAWKVPWTEEPGGLQSIGSQRVEHSWAPHRTMCEISDTRGQGGTVDQYIHPPAITCLPILPKLHQTRVFFKSNLKSITIVMNSFIRFFCASLNSLPINRLWKCPRNCSMKYLSDCPCLII